MSGEAVAPQPQIGDVLEHGRSGHRVMLTSLGMVNVIEHDLGNGEPWTLVGRVVPVDHPGIDALREALGQHAVFCRAFIRQGWDGDDTVGAACILTDLITSKHAALADLLALLASPGGPR